MGAALALAERGRGRTAPNPSVGCVIVRDGIVVGRGGTRPGGRPHAEAMALAQAGEKSRGATAYVTLEPCAHRGGRGPACADLLAAAGVARVVAARRDIDPRTDGVGLARLEAAGIATAVGPGAVEAARSMAGFLTRRRLGRPHVTLKLGLSLDGAAAMADGRSQWLTGAAARAHAHLERSRHEAILVGRGTRDADSPALDVRLAGLEARSPVRVLLSTHSSSPPGDAPTLLQRKEEGVPRAEPGEKDEGEWHTILSPHDIAMLPGDHLLVEGGARTAAAFLAADLVDRLLLYRAPVIVGGGRTLPDIGLADLADAHGRWRLVDSAALGADRVEVYERG